MRQLRMTLLPLVLIWLVLACKLTARSTAQPAISQADLVASAVAQVKTRQAVVVTQPPVEAVITQSPVTEPPVTQPPVQPAATDTPTATNPPPAPPPREENAPNPLPATHTGIILKDGDCYDLDTGNSPYLPGPQCDVLLVPILTLRPQNGAILSGYTTFEVPSRTRCETARFEPGDLALNTDLYICFRTNEGRYGFLIQRQDPASFDVASHRIIFDWWVFH